MFFYRYLDSILRVETGFKDMKTKRILDVYLESKNMYITMDKPSINQAHDHVRNCLLAPRDV